MPLPRAADGRLVLAADITCWLRPDADTSPQRILCHTYGRGKDQHIPAPGLPYSVICALEAGRSSWTAPLVALRLAPGDDAATVTARQMRELTERLIEAGQWKDGDPDILIVVDAGYDVPRLAFLLNDLPVQVLGRIRSDRVLRRVAPAREPGTRGRPPRHGGEFVFSDPAIWNTAFVWHRHRHRHRPGLGSAPPAAHPLLSMDLSAGHAAGRPPAPPRQRNPPAPAQDGHPAAITPGPPHAMTCTQSAKQTRRNPEERSQRPHGRAAQVKDQAKPCSKNLLRCS
ncbi:transposase [Streptomyces sp. Je 1-4]|nr:MULTISPECIES: transposase [unclassified Streptomyces]UYB39064.1 transposase [Streptomyces sp. Je 1-4]UZQ35064.1 transposase [Streptomyces sp. Je 1-4] [Streptomyces sp. Je 1-4 4N24]UZQ42482.1 transposase [Streptomyces sp. Je 1-4] [Streptomyces sp. Je 1-4 4N24_ara]